ncbi:cupin domain-containing protein [Methylopila sp. M107]|uniref:(R)-mandelonitrile lyase n=1 Tax=Methylopila sp. M107 TaxID=1101190 RepID=UPI00036B64D6|nr:cupin domain-containing protein [Methylopila sp. M107]
MKKTIMALAASTLAAGGPVVADETNRVTVQRAGSLPAQAGPDAYFTGSVRIDQPFKGAGDARVSGATVTFQPGARTAWHTHPLGQTLLIVSGAGRVQQDGQPIQEIKPGDVVWIPAGVKHWHGAAPDSAMSHVAIAEALDGKVVDWMEKVTDAQYRD